MRLPVLEELQRQTGRVVMHCAELEWVAYAAVRQFHPRGESRKLADREFKRRVGYLIEMSRCLPASKARRAWLLLWQRVRPLIDDRNAILHNPVVVDLYTNALGEIKAGGSRIHVFRKRRPQDKPPTFAFIRRTADKAERSSATAFRLWNELFPHLSLFEGED